MQDKDMAPLDWRKSWRTGPGVFPMGGLCWPDQRAHPELGLEVFPMGGNFVRIDHIIGAVGRYNRARKEGPAKDMIELADVDLLFARLVNTATTCVPLLSNPLTTMMMFFREVRRRTDWTARKLPVNDDDDDGVTTITTFAEEGEFSGVSVINTRDLIIEIVEARRAWRERYGQVPMLGPPPATAAAADAFVVAMDAILAVPSRSEPDVIMIQNPVGGRRYVAPRQLRVKILSSPLGKVLLKWGGFGVGRRYHNNKADVETTTVETGTKCIIIRVKEDSVEALENVARYLEDMTIDDSDEALEKVVKDLDGMTIHGEVDDGETYDPENLWDLIGPQIAPGAS